MKKTKQIITILFIIILIANIGLWYNHRMIKPMWINVPPVPSEFTLLLNSLGDKEFSYRMYSQKIQNMGDESGEGRLFSEYNYKNIYEWLKKLHEISPDSDIMPYLASYYYGATQDKEKIKYIIDFLRIAGMGDGENDWRWLVQAIFLSKHIKKDLPLSLEIAEDLNSIYKEGMPAWSLNMSSFINLDLGNKEAAYDLSMDILKYGVDKFDPAEIYVITEYLCMRVLNEFEAGINPICVSFFGKDR